MGSWNERILYEFLILLRYKVHDETPTYNRSYNYCRNYYAFPCRPSPLSMSVNHFLTDTIPAIVLQNLRSPYLTDIIIIHNYKGDYGIRRLLDT